MKSYGAAVIPWWDLDEEGHGVGGISYVCFYYKTWNPAAPFQTQIFGPKKDLWETNPRPTAELRDRVNGEIADGIIDWISDAKGPGRNPEGRRIICWDCSVLVSLLIRRLLIRRYRPCESWQPKKGEFFILETKKQVHTLIVRGRLGGAEFRFYSLKSFISSPGGWAGLMEKLTKMPHRHQQVAAWGPQDD